MPHHFIPNVLDTKNQMLRDLGLTSVDELFSDIPQEILLRRKLDLPPSMSEIEIKRHMQAMFSKNKPFTKMISFLGCGAWPHYIPAHVTSLIHRAEFLTAYTPYQSESSQGILQALFEYQSFICELTGLEVANASMYDWATALGEAALMCSRITGRKKFIVPRLISPERLSVLRNYARGPGLKVIEIGYEKKTGLLDLDQLRKETDEDTAGVYIENPNYFGFLETQVDEIEDIVHKIGALFVVGVYPISLGILKGPGEYGADIVVGEGQPLGNPVSFGGPALGIFACRGEERFIRQLPGRLIGMTTTLDGKTRGYTMTLQTREQHIRRERATSNICSNETLCAVAAAIYLSSLGPKGFRELAEICAANASYAMKRLNSVEGLESPIFDSPHFNEFTLRCNKPKLTIEKFNRKLLKCGIQGGRPVRKEFPELGETAILCTTEVHTKEDIDKLVEAAAKIAGGRA